MKEWKGRVLVEGTAEGEAIVTDQPFGFFGGVDPTTGVIIDAWHELHGQSIKDKVFVFPEGRGSTVGAAIILELVRTASAPAAVPAAADWGLSFPKEGESPAGNVSAEDLAQYNAYYLGDTSQKVLYLTFDCGYENGYTEAILDALKKHSAPAAFFVVGHMVESAPDIVRRMAEEGHIVGNHTFHHPDMSSISDLASFQEELTDPVNAAIGKLEIERRDLKKDGMPANEIVSYLQMQCFENMRLARGIRRRSKSLEECMKQVKKSAEERVKARSGMQIVAIPDLEVFKMAEDYYQRW